MASQIPSDRIPEHSAPATSPDESPTYNPSEDELKAIRLVERLYQDAKRAREKHDKNWIDNYKFFKGKQWKEKRPSYRHSEVINYVFSEIQSVLVILTDNRPNIDVLPQDPSDYEFAQILSQILTSKWDANAWSYVLAEAILDAAIYGTAIAEVPWKSELAEGLGDFTFETVDPLYFYPDPNARHKVNDEYCGHTLTAIPTDVGKLKTKYPDKAAFIKPDTTNLGVDDSTREDADDVKVKSPVDNRVLLESGISYANGKSGQALLLCAYLKSDEVIEECIGNDVDVETGLEKELYQTKKKYPNGRKIEVVGGVLLSDSDNEYSKFPYARLVDHIMPREFWGVGEVEQLKSPQQIVNKLVSYLLDVLILTGNPVWVVDTSSGVDTDHLTNQPGLIIEKNPGSEVRREMGVQLQPFVMQALEHFSERVMGKLGSTSDVSRGVAPSANPSGFAIEQLQEAAQTKLRGKSRNVETFLKDVGDLMVDRILDGYSIPRVVRLTNNESAPTYFTFHVSDAVDEAGEVKKIATIIRKEFDEASGTYIEQAPEEYQIKSKLDIRISTGTSLPLAKAQKAMLADKLFNYKIIDAEEYLNQIDYPKKEKIIERLKQQAATMPQDGGMNGNT